MSPIAPLAILFLTVCITPVAFGGIAGLQALYLVPLALLVWVLRTRTVADKAGLTVRTVWHTRTIAWTDLTGLRLVHPHKRRANATLVRPSRTSAVLRDGSEIPLPEVRTRHLSLLSEISDGLLPDPRHQPEPAAEPHEAAEPAEAAEERERETGDSGQLDRDGDAEHPEDVEADVTGTERPATGA
jgi:Bacterial PH domain